MRIFWKTLKKVMSCFLNPAKCKVQDGLFGFPYRQQRSGLLERWGKAAIKTLSSGSDWSHSMFYEYEEIISCYCCDIIKLVLYKKCRNDHAHTVKGKCIRQNSECARGAGRDSMPASLSTKDFPQGERSWWKKRERRRDYNYTGGMW